MVTLPARRPVTSAPELLVLSRDTTLLGEALQLCMYSRARIPPPLDAGLSDESRMVSPTATLFCPLMLSGEMELAAVLLMAASVAFPSLPIVAEPLSTASLAGSSSATSTALPPTCTVSASVTFSAATLYSPFASAASSVSTPSMTVLTLSTRQPSAALAVNCSSWFAGTSTGLVSSPISFPS